MCCFDCIRQIYCGFASFVFYCCCFKIVNSEQIDVQLSNIQDIINTINNAQNNAGLTVEYKQLLQDITPNFSENLRRAFNNEGVRNINRNANKPILMEDAAFSKLDVYYKLTNINLLTYPDFRVVNLETNFENLLLQSNFSLGNLKIECNYEVVNKTAFSAFTISQYGKILFTLNNVKSDGQIGIYIVEDSFLAKTYNLIYSLENVEMEISQYTPSGIINENQATTNYTETPLGLLWRQMTEKLNNILHRQLGAVIVEYSVNEILIDEPDTLRTYQAARIQKSNAIFDKIVYKTKNTIVTNMFTSIQSQGISMTFKQSNNSIERGTLSTDKCKISDLATLSRIENSHIIESGAETTVFGYLTMKDLKFEFDDYTINYMNQNITGKILSTVRLFKMLVAITVDKNGECIKPVAAQIVKIGDIENNISGHQSLSWLQEQLITWINGYIDTHSVIIKNVFVNSVKIMAISCD